MYIMLVKSLNVQLFYVLHLRSVWQFERLYQFILKSTQKDNLFVDMKLIIILKIFTLSSIFVYDNITVRICKA